VNDGVNLDSVQEKRGAPRGAPVYSSRRPRAPRRTLWEPLLYAVGVLPELLTTFY
jgi:hypothetical protein